MISWLMDRLSDRVNHGYWYAPDPHSIKNNHYGQWGQPEENNMVNNSTVAIPYKTCPSNLQFQGAANLQFCGSSGGNGLVGISTIMPNTTTGSISSPSAAMIAFTDANGSVWALAVDLSYVSAMTQISQAHQMKAANTSPTPTPPSYVPAPTCMLEGDFTEGEMELAETIIEELKGGKDKGCK